MPDTKITNDPTPERKRERPILFSGSMVRAILEGRKTQTRRVAKGITDETCYSGVDGCNYYVPVTNNGKETPIFCPYGGPGDRLWVRETLGTDAEGGWLYGADCKPVMVDPKDETAMIVWTHHKQQDYCVSIHMPRWASRITLEITGVHVERVQEISEADAQAEGAPLVFHHGVEIASSHRQGFHDLWESINGKKHPWASNPWVWIVEFKRVDNA